MDDKTTEILFQIGKIGSIIVIGIMIMVIILFISKRAMKKSELDPMVYKFVYNALKIVLVAVILVIILGQMGFKTGSIIAVIGVAGGAVALALKDSLANVAGGLIIIFTKQFKQGDLIEINGTQGLVESIDLMMTTLRTYDNKNVTLPNGLIISSIVTNHTARESRRVQLKFGISYEADVDKAKRVMLEVASSMPEVHKKPDPFAAVEANSDSAVELIIRVWCNTKDFWTVTYYLTEEIKKAFDREGIDIPFNRMDVNIVGDRSENK